MTTDPLNRKDAQARDAQDPMSRFRERFYLNPDTLYMDGNSLGLLSRDSEAAVLQALENWKTLGIDGWLQADPPWFWLGEELGKRQASLVGAEDDEVVVTGSITVNLHALVATTAATKRVLVHGDFSPKNILVHDGRLILLDHEVIHFGDPAFDLGFSMAHLLSKAHYLPDQRARFAEAARLAWRV